MYKHPTIEHYNGINAKLVKMEVGQTISFTICAGCRMASVRQRVSNANTGKTKMLAGRLYSSTTRPDEEGIIYVHRLA